MYDSRDASQEKSKVNPANMKQSPKTDLNLPYRVVTTQTKQITIKFNSIVITTANLNNRKIYTIPFSIRYTFCQNQFTK